MNVGAELRHLKDVLDEVACLTEDLVYEENARGGEARQVVYDIAYLLDIRLSEDIVGDGLWSPENMRRAVDGVKALKKENALLKVGAQA